MNTTNEAIKFVLVVSISRESDQVSWHQTFPIQLTLGHLIIIQYTGFYGKGHKQQRYDKETARTVLRGNNDLSEEAQASFHTSPNVAYISRGHFELKYTHLTIWRLNISIDYDIVQ